MDEVQPSMEDDMRVGIDPRLASSVDPLEHQRFRGEHCENHVPPIGYPRSCGLYKRTLVGGAEISGYVLHLRLLLMLYIAILISQSRLLRLLMALPTELRDRIYDFLVFDDVPEVVHAAWLSPLQVLVIPLRSAYPGRQHAMPSLENKGQGWNTGTTRPLEMDFCHVQGVVLNLHKLANSGCASAVKVRNDVLGFLGRVIVLELQCVDYEKFYQPPECKWSTLCVSTLLLLPPPPPTWLHILLTLDYNRVSLVLVPASGHTTQSPPTYPSNTVAPRASPWSMICSLLTGPKKSSPHVHGLRRSWVPSNQSSSGFNSPNNNLSLFSSNLTRQSGFRLVDLLL